MHLLILYISHEINVNTSVDPERLVINEGTRGKYIDLSYRRKYLFMSRLGSEEKAGNRRIRC